MVGSGAAFAAVKVDGSVVTWGYADRTLNAGGDSSAVAAQSRRAAAGRAELLAKGQYTDRLQNLAKLRRFRIGGRIRWRIGAG